MMQVCVHNQLLPNIGSGKMIKVSPDVWRDLEEITEKFEDEGKLQEVCIQSPVKPPRSSNFAYRLRNTPCATCLQVQQVSCRQNRSMANN